MGSLRLQPLRLGTSQQQQQQPVQDDPLLGNVDRQSGLFNTLTRPVMGGVGAVGNLLDLPGSFVRDVVSGNNPVDQLLSPFSSRNRSSGRDMLRTLGLAGRKDNWGNFAGGLGAEILLDPLTYMTFGASAIGKAGQVAKAANAAGKLGRARRIGTKFGSVLDDATDAQRAAMQAFSDKKGWGNIENLREDRLGGLFGIGLPMATDKQIVVGAGETGEKISKALDKGLGAPVKAYDYLIGDRTGLDSATIANRVKTPLRMAFDRKVRGQGSPEAQALAEQITKLEDELDLEYRKQIAPIKTRLEKSGVFSGPQAVENSRMIDRYLENASNVLGPGSELPAHLLPLKDDLDELKRLAQETLPLERAAGLDTPQLADHAAEYFPRMRNAFEENAQMRAAKKARLVDGRAVSARLPFLKNFAEGKSIIQEMSMDPEISGVALRGKNPKEIYVEGLGQQPRVLTDDIVKHVRQVIRRKYGDDLVTVPMNDPELDQLAKFLATLDPRHADEGVPLYTINPVDALERRLKGSTAARASVEKGMDYAVQNAKTAKEIDDAGSTAFMSIYDAFLNEVPGLNRRGAQEALLRKFAGNKEVREKFNDELRAAIDPDLGGKIDFDYLMNRVADGDQQFMDLLFETEGKSPFPSIGETLDTVFKNVYIDNARGKDFRNLMGGILEGDKAFNSLWKMFRQVTDVNKYAQTAMNPKFHTRNRISGLVRNLLFDATDLQSERLAEKVIGGKKTHGLKEIFGGATEEEAVERLQNELYTYNVVEGQGQHGEVDLLGGSTHNVVGAKPVTMADVTYRPLKKLPGNLKNILTDKGNRWQRTKDAATEYKELTKTAGDYVEQRNRVAPYIKLRKEGLSAEAASKRVAELQIDYANKSDFEKNVMRHVFPYYSFTKGNTPLVANELLQRPGGRLGQAIQASAGAQATDEATPDWISDTTSVPLGRNEDGTKHYLTSLGLMFEDAMGFAQPDPRKMGVEAMSRMNPLITAPIEFITQKKLFQDANLEDADPTLGRIMSNLSGRDLPYNWAGGNRYATRSLEHALSASPVGSALAQARQLTDTRKSPLQKALNSLSGIKVTSVSPEKQAQVYRDRIYEALKSEGARTLERPWLPPDILEGMSPEQQAEVQAMKALLSELARQSRARKAEK